MKPVAHVSPSGIRFFVHPFRFVGYGGSTGHGYVAISEDRTRALLANDDAADAGTAVVNAMPSAVSSCGTVEGAEIYLWDNGSFYRYDEDSSRGEQWTEVTDGFAVEVWPALEALGAGRPYRD